MKYMCDYSRKLILVLALCAMIFHLAGCAQPGETQAEGYIRHRRVSRINQQQMVSDLDSIMLTDKPTRLSDKRIP